MRRTLRSHFPQFYRTLKVNFGRLTADQLAAQQRCLSVVPPAMRRHYSRLTREIFDVHDWVTCEHTNSEALEVVTAIARTPPTIEGVVVEAGCFKGGSAAKLSLACAFHNRKLVLFDSFEGMPSNEERHEKITVDQKLMFKPGSYSGSLAEVQDNVRRYGRIETCIFKKGWFEQTMPSFDMPVIAAFIDVDLAASTRTCMKYLYPLLVPGGVIFSQDGHLKLVVDVLKDEKFWRDEVGVPMPPMDGLGTRKLVAISKPH